MRGTYYLALGVEVITTDLLAAILDTLDAIKMSLIT